MGASVGRARPAGSGRSPRRGGGPTWPRGRADVNVTANLSEFPPRVLGALDIEAQSPDEFLLNQLDLDPDRTMWVLHEQAMATRKPAITIQTLLQQLARCGVPGFADATQRQLWRIPPDS